MKVAIVFIGTARYINFFPGLYESTEDLLFPGVEKEYFVFTDAEFDGEVPDNINVIQIENLGFPGINLFTYEIIQKSFDQLSHCDYFFFMDADTRVATKIELDEVFPEDKPLCCVHHPCHYLKMAPNDKFPGSFDTNPESTACVKEGESFDVYWQSCIWGGTMDECKKLIDTLTINTRIDDDNGVMAKWHDESHMNRYLLDNVEKVHTLHPSFAYPEVFRSMLDWEPKIVHLAKENSEYQVDV